ncbi:hypothetical protein TWF569_003780 [Orbilia oligospora]|uniref:Uncharacterized protein n=1 Tax=Orbilia oligospora TaxID=2813651 RepID=A0A7C8J2Y9_ORBOL|nr:hypothetical protein TWF102_011756 [Orbilia oligospora]KAF3104569.1 hypothetical protein TWF103_006891 [Orbilia oligospora]KAF3116423.1 hypothetical protein TWF706_004061 [Orbilia oligospora]KAF3128773.1 hypothetical protein TWF594_011445 [Orbilia oligospora]KAF3151652.1 hypothetical protein TWF569_003780 [Orbilia oligospora]
MEYIPLYRRILRADADMYTWPGLFSKGKFPLGRKNINGLCQFIRKDMKTYVPERPRPRPPGAFLCGLECIRIDAGSFALEVISSDDFFFENYCIRGISRSTKHCIRLERTTPHKSGAGRSERTRKLPNYQLAGSLFSSGSDLAGILL